VVVTIPPQYVKAILPDGKELNLSKKRVGNTQRISHCSFFEVYHLPPFDIHLRVDWSDTDSNNDPTLDAQVWENGKQLEYGWWHQTPKDIKDQEWIYQFKAFGLDLIFRLGFTTEASQQGVARIVSAIRDEAAFCKEALEQYAPWAFGEKQLFCAECQMATTQTFTIDRNKEICRRVSMRPIS
jgi:hypothetical protein